MSVSSVSHSLYLQQLTSTSTSTGKAGSGAADRCAGSAGGQGTGNSFVQSLQQALSKLNGGGSSVSNSGNAQAAIQAFLQQLLAALHQAGTGAQHAAKASDGDGDDGVQSASSTTGTQTSGYNGTIQADLQSLIQQVSASSASGGGLQQSFQNMLSAMGANSSTDTLGGFLQSIASNMQGSSLISTTA